MVARLATCNKNLAVFTVFGPLLFAAEYGLDPNRLLTVASTTYSLAIYWRCVLNTRVQPSATNNISSIR